MLSHIYKKYFNTFYVYNYILKSLINSTTTNLFNSVKYFLYKELLNTFNAFKLLKSTNYYSGKYVNSLKLKNAYTLTVKNTSIPFFKNKINKFLYLQLITLLTNYFNYTNVYNLQTLYVPLNTNFFFYTFINLFYFKIRNN